ncbi:MAG: GDP-perosamine synthase [Candidatus Hydrogenedentota bacterium]
MIPHSKPLLGNEEANAARRVLESGMLAQGREVRAFEDEFAAALDRRHAVAVGSGTAALHLALLALGIGNDDSVAIPSYACAALPQAIALCHARPMLLDANEDFLADHSKARPEAHIVAHLFGATACLPEGAPVIEDIAQSLGGATGAGGLCAVASFYATKMMTTAEGGMLLTDDDALAEEARDRRDYDNRDDWKPRFAYKMTDLAAAIGREQLKRLPRFCARRLALADRYHEGLAALPVRLPRAENHVYFRYVVATPRRDALMAFLAERGIEAKRPVHRPAHHFLGGDFPGADRAHHEGLSIPLYPALTDEEAEHIIAMLRAFFEDVPG